MRTIKFRALKDDMSNCRFYYGSLIYDKEGNPRIYDVDANAFHTCIKGTEGQFTVLHDKNGKEIYTGDILQLKRLDGSVLFYKIFCVKGGFAFNAHQDDFYKPLSEIYFYESTSDMQSSGFIRTLEIIGNLYENPELLEKKFSD